MATTPRSFFASNRDTARLVERAKKFSVRLPVVGKVTVPPPDQLAFYGVLGILAAVNVIDWPVALAIGVGQAVVARHFGDRAEAARQRGTPAGNAAAAKSPAAQRKARTAASKATGRGAVNRDAVKRAGA